MAECIMDKSVLPENNVYLSGFECKRADRYLCPNFMHSMVNGRNCRLLQKNKFQYSRLCLRSRLEPIKELYKNKPTEELKQMFEQYKKKYQESKYCNVNVQLRSQLGAIEELLSERGA